MFMRPKKNFDSTLALADSWRAHPENIIKINDIQIAAIDFSDCSLSDFAAISAVGCSN